MITRLFWLEVSRLVIQVRLLILAVVMVGMSIYSFQVPNRGEPTRLSGSVSLIASSWVPLIVPVIAGVISAGSLAEDRRRKYTSLVLARGISRWHYLLAKAIAMVVSSALAALLIFGIFYIIAFLFLPPGRSALPQTNLPFPGPSPLLFHAHPLLNDLLSIAMVIVATATLSLTGLLVAVVFPNEYVAAAVPFLAVVACIYLLRGPFEVISPFVYIDVWSYYPRKLPAHMLHYAAFAYWIVIGVLLMVVSSSIFLRKEME